MKRLSLLAVLIAPAAFAQVNLYPNASQFWDVTTVNDVPVSVGLNTSQYFFMTGTDIGTMTLIGGNNVTTGRANISEDGTKISGNLNSSYTFLDNAVHSAMARYDRTTSSWTEFGHLNYHGSSGTKEASNSWGLSGDGNTIAGQGYYQTLPAGSPSARANAAVATTAGATNMYPTITNNGRIAAINFDGTVAAGWREGTSPNYFWVKTAGVWSAPQLITAMVAGVPTNLTAIADMDGEGRFMTGNGGTSGKFWVYDRLNGTAEVVTPPMTGSITVFSISKAADMVTYRVVPPAGNPFFEGRTFIWTRETGSVLLNDHLDGFSVDRQTASMNNLWGMSPNGEWHVGYSWIAANQATLAKVSTNYRGTASLGSYPATLQSSVPTTFELRQMDGTLVSTWTQNLGPDGRFLKMLSPTFASGQYKLWVKASHWLSKTVTVDFADRGAIVIPALVNGDVDGNNIIDVADYSALALAFDAVLDEDVNTAGNQSSPNWLDAADLDASGVVDIADYTILATNFDGVGEN
ncbi:MAG: hypothetical protein JNJ45_04415 [Chthonomonas sp.]|nr:hypothetical protein [Chthonomonas sp.]